MGSLIPSITIDPLAIIPALIQQHRLNDWARLFVSVFLSFFLSGTFACGTALMARQPWPFAIGSGLVTASVMATVAYRRSAVAKGTAVALPVDEATKELGMDTQVINK